MRTRTAFLKPWEVDWWHASTARTPVYQSLGILSPWSLKHIHSRNEKMEMVNRFSLRLEFFNGVGCGSEYHHSLLWLGMWKSKQMERTGKTWKQSNRGSVEFPFPILFPRSPLSYPVEMNHNGIRSPNTAFVCPLWAEKGSRVLLGPVHLYSVKPLRGL